MIKIRGSTIGGQEFQMRALTTDPVNRIKEAVEKILAVEHVHLYYKDSWLDPSLTLGSYYVDRDMTINVVISNMQNDQDQMNQEAVKWPQPPTMGIDQHLAWQPTREDNTYWDGMDTPIILDTDPKNLPQSAHYSDDWFFEQSHFYQQERGSSSSSS